MLEEARDFLKSRQKMNLLIVIINIIVYMIMECLGDTTSASFMLDHGAMYPPAVTEGGEYYRLFTCMFLHFGPQHLLYNMFLLIFAGDMLEKVTGGLRYLLIYLGGGVLGNVLSLAVSLQKDNPAVSAGASGAVFAVVGGLFYLMLRNRKRMPAESGRRMAIMAVLMLVNGFMQSGTDSMAHLGGFLGGVVICALTMAGRFRRQKKADR